MPFHSGFVCLLGRPNAGKSTLLNTLVGEKLAIISPKPQTTRNRILGIVQVPKKNKLSGQIVVLDTPGVHKPDSSLGKKMMSEVREALERCDLILLMADSSRRSGEEDRFVVNMAKRLGKPVFLLLNKIDLLRSDKQKLLPIMEEYRGLHDFKEIIPLSARKREGLDTLLEKVLENLPRGKPHFEDNQITDQPARFMAAEIIRERILFEVKEEVPHAVGVLIERFEEAKNLTRIAAVIYCEREGQKRILVGRKGQMLKVIGTTARLQIEKMLGTKVFLELFVKAQENWRNSYAIVQELDWRSQFEDSPKRLNVDALSRSS
jgi:GTP-binding protein Era